MKASSPAAVAAGASHQRSVRRCGAAMAARVRCHARPCRGWGSVVPCQWPTGTPVGVGDARRVRGRAGRGRRGPRRPCPSTARVSYGVSGMVTMSGRFRLTASGTPSRSSAMLSRRRSASARTRLHLRTDCRAVAPARPQAGPDRRGALDGSQIVLQGHDVPHFRVVRTASDRASLRACE